jgi:hypothetical protein
MLDRWLKHELSKGSWDVENVEVKGQCPELTWGMHKFELKTYKSGQLAKLPREAMTRAEELQGTTRIKVEELRRLKVPEAVKVESDDSVGPIVERAGGSVVSGKKERKRAGSIAGRHFGDDELSRLKDGYLSLAGDLIGDRKLVATGRKVVTVEDLAVFLMLLRFFTNNMNVDGSLPRARWRDMWLALYSCGDIERGWCHHRYARMRNFLDEQGLLSWENEDFTVGVFDDAGRFVPGEAAKWRASEELMEMMEQGGVLELVVLDEEKKEEEKSILYGCSPQDQGQQGEKEEEKTILYGHNQQEHEKNEEEKSILYGCNGQDHGQLEKNEEEEGILHGHTAPRPPNSTRKPRQSESFRSLLDSLGIWIPLTKPRFVGYAWQPMRMAA